MDYSPPEITEGIGRIIYTWKDLELRIIADRITDDGSAELWFYHDNKTKTSLLNITKANLLSSPTMSQLAKRMQQSSGDVPWQQILTAVSSITLEKHRQGEPPVIIEPSPAEVTKPCYYLPPLIMKGIPNVIFGDKGVNKTTIGLMALGLLANGATESPSGLVPDHQANIALLDWEGTQELTEYTIARLIGGETVPWFSLPYLRCKHPLADDMDKVSNFLSQNKTDVVLIDSLGQAAGSDRFDSAGKSSAIRFFEALRQLNITSLVIAQNAKGEDRKKTIFGSTYFTYYSRNIWELRQDPESVTDDDMSIALFHEAANYSKRHKPLGWRVSYTDTTISIASQSVTLSDFLEKVSQAKALLDFLKSGAKTRQGVANALKISVNQAGVILNRQRSRGTVKNLGSGLWGLQYEDDKNIA